MQPNSRRPPQLHPDVRRLTALLPVPSPPTAPTPWEQAPQEVGFRFPADYRDVVDVYGGGALDEELTLHVPTRRPFRPGLPGGFRGLTEFAAREIGPALAGAAGTPPGTEAPPFFPSPGGLLFWGRDLSGNHLLWDTRDAEPDRWPVAVWFRDELPDPVRLFDGGVAAFLLALVEGSYPHTDLLLPPTGLAGRRWTRTEDWERRYS
jgi:hypothetical protein